MENKTKKIKNKYKTQTTNVNKLKSKSKLKSKTLKIKIKMKKKQNNNRKNKHFKQSSKHQQLQLHLLKMKGNGVEEQINVIEITNIENIQSELTHVYNDLNNYAHGSGLVYFSLGSKFNEPTLTYKGIGVGKDETFRSNSSYQMVPSFLYADSIQREMLLCNEKICNCLCIVLDSFSPQELENNIAILKHSFRIHLSSNIKVYILNTYQIRGESENNILITEKIVATFCDELISKNISSEHFMLCNYIKFKSTLENVYEESLKNRLTNVLREKNYENSHYEWFGYKMSGNYLFYDFIYLNKQFTENHLLQLIYFMVHLLRNAILSGKISNTVPRNEQIYELTESIYTSNTSGFELNKEKMKYVYQITRMTSIGDLSVVNNLFTYSLHNMIRT